MKDLHSQSSERAVIGSIFLDSQSINEISIFLKPEYFYDVKNKKIFKCLLDMHIKNLSIDRITFWEFLDQDELKISRSYVAEIISEMPTSSFIKQYAKIIVDSFIQRKMIDANEKNIDLIRNGKPQKAKMLLDLSIRECEEIKNSIESPETHVKKIVEESIKEREKMQPGQLRGFSTGFKKLNDVTNGFQKGKLYVLGAKSSHGKSMMAISLINAFLQDGASAIYFSLEMSQVQIVNRLLAACSGERIYDFEFNTKNSAIHNAYNIVSEYNLNVYHTVRSHVDMINITKHAIYKNKCDIIFIDYFQNLSTFNHKDQYEMLRLASEALQDFSIKNNVAIVALSQLNKDNQFKGASDIHDSCDVAIYIERERDEMGELIPQANLFVQKNRQGRTGRIPVYFQHDKNKILEVVNH